LADPINAKSKMSEIMHYKLVASAGSATAIVSPQLCTSFNVAELINAKSKIEKSCLINWWLRQAQHPPCFLRYFV